MTDGISDMLGMREKAKRKTPGTRVGERVASPSRQIPSPRNPAKAPVVAVAPTAETPTTREKPVEQPPQVAAPAASEAAITEDRRATLYIAAAADEWLESARLVGRHAGVDASRSAIVRIALERLMDQMSHDQIVAELARRATASGPTRGRRRL